MNSVEEAESHLNDVVLGIAFFLKELFELLKYLLSIWGTYIKAGKLQLQAYYSLPFKQPLLP